MYNPYDLHSWSKHYREETLQEVRANGRTPSGQEHTGYVLRTVLIAMVAVVLVALMVGLARPASAQEPRTLVVQKDVVVKESAKDVDTGIDIRPLDRLIVTADGEIWAGWLGGGTNGPEGEPGLSAELKFPLNAYPLDPQGCYLGYEWYDVCSHPYSLIGKLNGKYFHIGSTYDAVHKYDTSRFYLSTNDDAPGNGSGQFNAHIQVWRDITPPQTAIETGPSGSVANGSATFQFSSTEADAKFQCALDGAPFTSCASPKEYTSMSEGSHTFAVRAVDAVGNADNTPAERRWTVDTTAPSTTITSGPSGTVASTSASFGFSSSEPNSRFECSLDGAAFSACSSPTSYSGLANGKHTFRVRATDAAGNADLIMASRSWFVDTVVPRGTVSINGGKASTTSRSVTLRLSASDPAPASGVAWMRFRNGGTTTWSGWVAYSTSKSWTLTAGAGTKTVYVQYKDRAGNLSATASDTIKFSP